MCEKTKTTIKQKPINRPFSGDLFFCFPFLLKRKETQMIIHINYLYTYPSIAEFL